MKQNHKKIKIYSEAFCSLVTNFQEFQTTKIMLNDFVVLMKKDSTISAFLQSKSIDRSQKVGIFKNALNDIVNNDLLDDDTNSHYIECLHKIKSAHQSHATSN